MYSCLHSCMHVCVKADICMYARCMYACVYVCMHTCMYACMHICMYIYIYIYLHVYVYISTCICIHVCTDANIHTCTHTYIHLPDSRRRQRRREVPRVCIHAYTSKILAAARCHMYAYIHMYIHTYQILADASGGEVPRVAQPGDSALDAVVKEHMCNFHLNFGEVYWNSRLQAEHTRLVNSFVKGEEARFCFCV